MGALSILAKRDTDVADDGHVYAHGIGIAAYRDPQTVGETFSRCTAEFQSGCYHGVIQAYFALPMLMMNVVTTASAMVASN